MHVMYTVVKLLLTQPVNNQSKESVVFIQLILKRLGIK
jgi:hypothetical protein